jgi:hypothetical protein
MQARPLARKPFHKLGWMRSGAIIWGLWALCWLLVASCGGYPDGVVVVRVSGLVPNITELSVTMQLDGTNATNTRPSPGVNSMTFLVTDDMSRFGIQVPAGTQSIGLKVIGYDTDLVVIRMGTTTLDVTQGKDFAITLAGP